MSHRISDSYHTCGEPGSRAVEVRTVIDDKRRETGEDVTSGLHPHITDTGRTLGHFGQAVSTQLLTRPLACNKSQQMYGAEIT